MPKDSEDTEGVDFALVAYREENVWHLDEVNDDLLHDIDSFATELRRYPGDFGSLGLVSIDEDFFVLVRVAGERTRVLLSDVTAATEWPIARDVADMLGEEIPDPDEEEAEPMGDLGILSDLGVSDFDMSTLIDNLDLSSDQMLIEIADKIKIGPQFRKVAESAFP